MPTPTRPTIGEAANLFTLRTNSLRFKCVHTTRLILLLNSTGSEEPFANSSLDKSPMLPTRSIISSLVMPDSLAKKGSSVGELPRKTSAGRSECFRSNSSINSRASSMLYCPASGVASATYPPSENGTIKCHAGPTWKSNPFLLFKINEIFSSVYAWSRYKETRARVSASSCSCCLSLIIHIASDSLAARLEKYTFGYIRTAMQVGRQ